MFLQFMRIIYYTVNYTITSSKATTYILITIQQLTYKQFRRLRIRTFKFAVYSTNAHGATCTVLRTQTHTMYKQVPTWNNTTTTNTSMLQFRFSVTCYKPIKCYHNPKRKHMTLHTITNRMMDCKRILTQVKRPFYKYLTHTHIHYQ